MAKRKSLLGQLYSAHQKAQLERERARKHYEADVRRLEAQMEKKAEQECREEDRAAQARLRQQEQAERAQQQAVAKAERLAAQQ